MDREVIEQKLESLRRCLARVARKCPPTAEALAQDADIQDIITLNLTRAVQLCVDIGSHLVTELDIEPPATMGATFDALSAAGVLPQSLSTRLQKAVGFRNIAVHNYEKIDWQIVHAIARNHLDDFHEFARIVDSRFLTQ